MTMRTSLAVISFLLFGCVVAAADESTPHQIDSAAKALSTAVESGRVIGASHLVWKDGQEIHFATGGVRDVENQEPFARDTIVRIYSMTKPITTVAAMQLLDDGKFALDDPVAKYIPAFAKSTVFERDGEPHRVVSPKRPITIRDVMRHTTGYGYDGGGNKVLNQAYTKSGMVYHPPNGMLPPRMTIERAANALAGIPAHHHPGERFTYGYSTDLLGRLVEVWSEQSLDDYFRTRLFKPIGMNDTGFRVPDQQTQSVCQLPHP